MTEDRLLLAELLAQRFTCVMQVGGHHVFQQHAEPGAGCAQGQPAAQRARSDDGDCGQARLTWR